MRRLLQSGGDSLWRRVSASVLIFTLNLLPVCGASGATQSPQAPPSGSAAKGTDAFAAMQRLSALFAEIHGRAQSIEEKKKAAGTEERQPAEREADRRELLRIVVKHTSAAERKAAAGALAQAMHLTPAKKTELLAIAEESEALVVRFSTVLREEDAIRPSPGKALPNWIDWGCRWAGNPTEVGTEVGPDFWVAAFVCFIASIIAPWPAPCLVVHHHDGWWGANLWVEPAFCG